MNTAKSLENHTFITPGKYDGLWSGYYVEIIFENGRKSEKIKLNQGVRGINCKCQVEVNLEGEVIVY